MLEFNMRALQDALDGERRGISSHAHDFLVFIAISEIADPWRSPRDKPLRAGPESFGGRLRITTESCWRMRVV
jgi:hypothetical protein